MMTETTRAWRVVLLLLALYVAGFFAFYPNVITVEDEGEFIGQARTLSTGRLTMTQLDPWTDEPVETTPGTYILGTPALMAPFVGLFGWRGAYLVPCLGLLAAVLLTGAWIRREGGSPIFAVFLLGFFPMLVMARIAMSDVPSTAIVAAGLWMFWRGIDGRPRWWLASGFVAGASLAFRVTNVLPFLALFAGTVVRRERKCVALVAGGVVGLALRAGVSFVQYGALIHDREPYLFEPWTIFDRLPLYLVGVLLLFPCGLVFGLAYRGRRRPEIVATVALYLVFFLIQGTDTPQAGWTKRLVIELRYLLELLPVLAFATAEALPRLWKAFLRTAPARMRPTLFAAAKPITGVWLVGIALAAVGVHPTFEQWASRRGEIAQAIHRYTGDDSVVVIHPNTRKYVGEHRRAYRWVDSRSTRPDELDALARRHGELFLVLLDRFEHPFWLARNRDNAAYVAALGERPALLLDIQPSSERLRIWRLVAEP